MKKKIIFLVLILFAVIGLFIIYKIFGPTVSANNAKYVYIKSGETYTNVKQNLLDKKIISSSYYFDKIANRFHYANKIKPGRYEVKDGSSLYNLVKMLSNGNQAAVNFVINKIRTKEEFAQKIAANFEADSLTAIHFFNSNDSLKKYNVDTNNVLTAIVPNSYNINWNTSVAKIYAKLFAEKEKFWTPERKQKAAAINYTPNQVYTIASIVDEETNLKNDKGKVASVYLNRLAKGMKLEADPTLKFALKDFGLKRILNKHKEVASPYNTYINSGLPPGPICTPSAFTIDAVLNAPKTDYIFFVAQPNLTGASDFTSNYADHIVYAKRYQAWIAEYLKNKQASISK